MERLAPDRLKYQRVFPPAHATLPTHRRLVLESVFEYEMIGADRRRMIRGWEHDQTVYDRAGAILAICCRETFAS